MSKQKLLDATTTTTTGKGRAFDTVITSQIPFIVKDNGKREGQRLYAVIRLKNPGNSDDDDPALS